MLNFSPYWVLLTFLKSFLFSSWQCFQMLENDFERCVPDKSRLQRWMEFWGVHSPFYTSLHSGGFTSSSIIIILTILILCYSCSVNVLKCEIVRKLHVFIKFHYNFLVFNVFNESFFIKTECCQTSQISCVSNERSKAERTDWQHDAASWHHLLFVRTNSMLSRTRSMTRSTQRYVPPQPLE